MQFKKKKKRKKEVQTLLINGIAQFTQFKRMIYSPSHKTIQLLTDVKIISLTLCTMCIWEEVTEEKVSGDVGQLLPVLDCGLLI